jgi:hypothetical protein
VGFVFLRAKKSQKQQPGEFFTAAIAPAEK